MERNSYENFTVVMLLLLTILCSTGVAARRIPKDNTPKGSRVYTLGFELILRGEVEIQKDIQPDYKAIPNLLLGELSSKHEKSDKIEPYSKGMVLRDNEVNTNNNNNELLHYGNI
ncbi:uncharacterized protein LOC130827530 [Amaranthus tricolor]|uniref:uncharacterized protein LOC130827530 n=1 Tax=Amaranthus tricolor TaxID=29722 RepID=UPI002588A362|nr:uncharacterized protein LOC130827530 [Amaranthus tricolor]